MKNIIFISIISLFISIPSFAAGGFGASAAFGIPFLTQIHAHYQLNDQVSFSAGLNSLSLDAGEASVSMTLPEVIVKYHPFAGAFFVGGGLGSNSLEVTATESVTSNKISAKVDSTAMIIKTGWMWGASDGGFWYGMDFSYISPSGASSTITAPGVSTSDPNYQDAVDAAEKYGETALFNLTLLRIGWMF